MSDKSNSLTSIGLAVPQAERKQVAENEDVKTNGRRLYHQFQNKRNKPTILFKPRNSTIKKSRSK